MPEAHKCDAIVIGAGVVGIACARALALAGQKTLLIEREAGIGRGISARGSRVMHAGLYYAPGSLKARLCRRGLERLYDYCAQRGVTVQRTGKLVVAAAGQEDELLALHANATANGVPDLELLGTQQLHQLEPALHCAAALYSRWTGIIDGEDFMQAMLEDFLAAGGTLATQTEVLTGGIDSNGITLHVQADKAETVQARILVNSAGLDAPAIAARLHGVSPTHIPQRRFAKGNYFLLEGQSPFQRLIYPLPEPGGLGVHLTLDLHGRARFGPDVEWIDAPEYEVHESRKAHFITSIRKYWPDCDPARLRPGHAGVRPKICNTNGDIATDFLIQDAATHGIPGLINLFGIESPGLTASMAIAEHVTACLGMRSSH